MELSPSSGIYAKGIQQQVSVVVSSGGEDVNAIEAHLRFDPDHIHIDGLSFDRSICADGQVLQQTINNDEGYVILSCVITGDAFADVKGNLVDINFTPISTGGAAITFDDGSGVLASDGLGTDVLRAVTSAYYRVFNKEDISDIFSPRSIVIPYSYTHENSAKWYNSNKVSVIGRLLTEQSIRMNFQIMHYLCLVTRSQQRVLVLI
jgi:hypothetical protein